MALPLVGGLTSLHSEAGSQAGGFEASQADTEADSEPSTRASTHFSQVSFFKDTFLSFARHVG